MSPGFIQKAILILVGILSQTIQPIHCEESSSNIDESYVLSLTKDTFNDAAKNNKYLLVKFIAPWCGHCTSLRPAYAAAAKELVESGSEIKLASVDATLEVELAALYGVQSYPAIKFFIDRIPIDYTGNRGQADIVSWVTKRTGPPADELETVDDLNKLKESDNVVVIGAFEDIDSAAAHIFIRVARTIDGIPLGITSNSDVLKELEVETDAIVLLKKFDEGRNVLTSSIDESSIREFIKVNQYPLIIDVALQSEAAQKIFNGDIKVYAFLFNNKSSENQKKLREEFETTAQKFRGKALFIAADTEHEDSLVALEYFGLKISDIPVVRLVSLEDGTTKFKPKSSDIDSEVLTKFMNAFFDGKLKPNFLSQAIPEDWDKNPVKILVRENLHEVATDKSKTVLVAFIAPWCGHCQLLSPIYDELGEKYRDNQDVIIAKVDATINEFEDIKIKTYPTMKLFPKNSDEVIDYRDVGTVEAFSRFIDSNGKENGNTADEQPVNESDEEEEEPIHEDL